MQDGWSGGARWKPPSPAPPPPPQTVQVRLGDHGLAFDGLGGITSNGECRLLYDYPEPQRGQILDYLFLPGFGLSSTILKVEIGSDAQSTVGTEPAYQHSKGLVSYDRGIQFWFLREAKKRNPAMVIAALEWSAPGWVGTAGEAGTVGGAGTVGPVGKGVDSGASATGNFFSQDNVDYILGWMFGACVLNNVTVDYLGVWNEPPIREIPPGWLLSLRRELDKKGYNRTQIIAPDAGPTQPITIQLLKDMRANATFQAAVDVVGTHGYWSAPPADFTYLMVEKGTRAWVSESWHAMGSWDGAMGMANKIMGAHLSGRHNRRTPP